MTKKTGMKRSDLYDVFIKNPESGSRLIWGDGYWRTARIVNTYSVKKYKRIFNEIDPYGEENWYEK